jgi:hypothetical protein
MPKLSKEEKQKHCSGCRQNFYNGNNPLGIKECWHLGTARLVKRFKIWWWTPMDKASNFEEVRVLSCYSDLENGHGNAYYTNIPSHLKAEWDKLQRQKKKEEKKNANKKHLLPTG